MGRIIDVDSHLFVECEKGRGGGPIILFPLRNFAICGEELDFQLLTNVRQQQLEYDDNEDDDNNERRNHQEYLLDFVSNTGDDVLVINCNSFCSWPPTSSYYDEG